MVSLNNNVEIYEWGFDKPSDQVNLHKIVLELHNLSEITSIMYMGNLKQKAPIVYERLRQYCKQSNYLKWWNFDANTQGKKSG